MKYIGILAFSLFIAFIHPQTVKASDWGFSSVYINTPASPFAEKKTWQDGTLSISGGSAAFTLETVPARIRGRGNSTWENGPDKRPLRFRFNKAMSLMGSEYTAKDWILLAEHFDGSLLRNYSAFYLAGLMGKMAFVPSAQHVHLYVNNEYMGVYLLTDERDVNAGRVEIEWDPDPEKSGYFLELDARASLDGVENKTYVLVDGLVYAFCFPGSSKLTPAHAAYAKNYLETLSSAIRYRSFKEVSKMIDLDSFIDFYIVQELFKNADIHSLSVFMYIKDSGGGQKLYMGPLWDFDTAAGNTAKQILGQGPEDVYAALFNYWYRHLMNKPEFFEAVRERWNEIRDVECTQTLAHIREISRQYQKDFERNFIRHEKADRGIIGARSPETAEINGFSGQVHYLVDWLEKRIAWLDGYFNSERKAYDPLETLLDFYTRNPIHIILNGEPYACKAPPINLHDRILFSLDDIAGIFDMAAAYTEANKLIALHNNDIQITHLLDGREYYLNGKEMNFKSPAPSIMIGGRIFIPIRPFLDLFGYEAQMDSETHTMNMRK